VSTGDPNSIGRAATILRGCNRLCISTGAGMSAESGVPTFRDADGYWSRFNPAELATPDAFRRAPLKVWEWYRLRRQHLTTVEPHEGHRVLARWETRFEHFTLITQNVDGLHHRAGSTHVLELHGRLDVVRCTGCATERRTLDDLGPDPRCEACGERVRPGVVWFGENLPVGAIDAAFAAAGACDAFLVIGTSGVVQPAASLADAARSAGAVVIEINPNPTPLSEIADVAIRSGSREALVALDEALA
jgi:NAD-dependent deacetylase